MPEVRQELLSTIKERLIPLGVLDEFKSAGVFVNWWQQIRYDLKTIVSTGWHHSLIPDDYLVAEFFQAEADLIESLEAKISEAESEKAEAVENAQEVAGYEPEEDEKVTATVIKRALKELIDDLKGSEGESAKKELARLQDQDKAIKSIEARIKKHKSDLKTKTEELGLKLQLKRLGADDFKAESQELIRQIDERLTELDEKNKDDKKKINPLNKDKKTLEDRIAKSEKLADEIGGRISKEDAQRLILQKLFDIASLETIRYLESEKRIIHNEVENLWEKYSGSHSDLEIARTTTLDQLTGFLGELGYAK